ncbi:MAG: hypothetical protein KAG28_09800 [Cocleimonas sp.]|nr:hypothetical protein [Cocleimonas sp.]
MKNSPLTQCDVLMLLPSTRKLNLILALIALCLLLTACSYNKSDTMNKPRTIKISSPSSSALTAVYQTTPMPNASNFSDQ